MIEMRLDGIHLDLSANTPVIMLRECSGEQRVIPIYIGAPEAYSIHLALEGIEPDRPLTHDLLITLAEVLDGQAVKLVLTTVQDNTYFAEIYFLKFGKLIAVSCRPSDGVAIAVRTEIPIYADEELLATAGQIMPEGCAVDAESIMTEFHQFIDSIRPEDFQS